MAEGRKCLSLRTDKGNLLVLLLINLAIYHPLLLPGYTQCTKSIEPLYMAVARFLSCNFPWPSWNPTWFCGYPFRIFYTPVLPYSMAVVSRIFGMDITSAYRLITGSAFIAVPMTLYLLARYLSGKPVTAFLASIGYSVLPSVMYCVPRLCSPVMKFAFAPWRLVVFNFYGEGPHTVALALTPLAVLYFLRALREAGPRNYILAGVFTSLVVLTNLAATTALGILMAGTLVAEMATEKPLKKMARAAIAAVLAYGLCAFWMNVSFVRACFSVGQTDATSSRGFMRLLPFAVLLILLFVSLFVRFRRNRELRSFLLLLVWLGGLGFITFSRHLFGVDVVPQPNRYVPELDMSFCVLAALTGVWVYERGASKGNRRKLVILCVLAIGLCSLMLLFYTRTLMTPEKEFDSFEKDAAVWFADHAGEEERVMLLGNASFWVNVFSDVPQMGGGLAQSDVNRHWKNVKYCLREMDNGKLVMLWAQAFNVRYILVNYPESLDPFNCYRYPGQFEGLLEPVYSRSRDVIFEVPPANPRLILKVSKKELHEMPPVRGVGNVSVLSDYTGVIERGVPPEYEMKSVREFRINADLREDEVLLARWNHDRGWRAFSGEKELEIREDPIGFMVIDPGSAGQHEIVLRHGCVWDQWLGLAITGFTLLILAGCGVYWMIRRRSSGL